MNLQLHLATRIAVVALACLLVIASYSMYQSHRSAEQATQTIAESLAKQLELQLLRIEAGIGQINPFPDFAVWKESGGQPGVCLAFNTANGTMTRSLCNGTKPTETNSPAGFAKLYQRIFDPGTPSVRPITTHGRLIGSLTITPSAELEIESAWNKTLDLLTLSSVTVFAVCLLVYLTIRRALHPAQTIVAGLEKLESGHLDYRLPSFELAEWLRIATAINKLSATQQQLLEERRNLAVKLINIQEQERRYLARELHDEFGQCLAAINAVATSIKQTATEECPLLIEDSDRISRITGHMLDSIRDLLGQLRPAEFDELGLAPSLNSLVTSWNGHSGGKTAYRLHINGDSTALSEPQAVALFRIAQECLTNIAKHAAASSVDICLTINQEAAVLNVQDNGIAHTLPFAKVSGIGLLGIRERVNALHGQLKLTIAKPNGLIVEARLPMKVIDERKT